MVLPENFSPITDQFFSAVTIPAVLLLDWRNFAASLVLLPIAPIGA